LPISVRLRNLIKRRPRPDMGWSAEEEEEEEEEVQIVEFVLVLCYWDLC
jgi:hypothetical protein